MVLYGWAQQILYHLRSILSSSTMEFYIQAIVLEDFFQSKKY